MGPSSIVILPTAPHTHTIIFLHGRGSNAVEFCSEIFGSQDSSDKFFTQLLPGVKLVFPCAKKTWAETDQEEIYQWFDITSVQNTQENPEIQRPGIYDSRAQLLRDIDEEAQQVPLSNIIVAGMSQGCATALYTLLSMDIRVGGFFGLCGWLPLAEELSKEHGSSERPKDMRTMPILLQHSKDDDVVLIANSELMHACLHEMGMKVKWQQFDQGGHWLNEPEGMDGIVEFIRGVMTGVL